jgi:hypothetical protein
MGSAGILLAKLTSPAGGGEVMGCVLQLYEPADYIMFVW